MGGMDMKKKSLVILMAVVVSILTVACDKSVDNIANTQNKNKIQQTESNDEVLKGKKMRFDELGLEYYIPEVWAEKGGISPVCVVPGKYGVDYIVAQIPYEFVPTEFIRELTEEAQNAKTEEGQTKIFEKYQNKAKDFFNIIVLDKSKEKNGPKENIERKEKVFLQYKYHEKVAEKDNLECYLLYNDEYDESGLSEEEKKEFKEVREGIEEFKKNIKLFTPIDPSEKMAGYQNIEFKTKTIDGKEIDSSIFKDYELTMVNIWATYCGPCIEEMPDIQMLYDEVKEENINVIGIVFDTPDEENEALAKEILEKKGAKFVNIIPDEKLIEGVLKDISGVPTTIFVDKKGNTVGKTIVGSRSKEEYKKEIYERLESLK
ncbi:TlpA family protein disulfide reductase [Crassaminicella thermophila]|uniref:TlpA family protein disulfide reductase n=2 Tax=Crassaminicella thermophila TaxID=2599308 RepID=A0A5C0SCK8_CRATE|nr:TlpA family protein disulfide reductase [Crassaminicella thermophila]